MSFTFSLGADEAKKQAEQLSDNDLSSGILNLKKIPENEEMYFRILPFDSETLETFKTNILTVKKWVFKGVEKDDKGNIKYISTNSQKSLGPDHKHDEDFGDWLVEIMMAEVERDHYDRDEEGSYTGEPLLDEKGNEILSLWVEDTENPAVQAFRSTFLYAHQSGKHHPVRTGEKLLDSNPIRFPDHAASLEYWMPVIQVKPELTIEEDDEGKTEKWSETIGEPLILSMPYSVFAQLAGGYYQGAEVPGLVNKKEVGKLLGAQYGIDLCIVRTPRSTKGSNFTVTARMSATGSQSWIEDYVYEDENRINGLEKIREGINTEECKRQFSILIGAAEEDEETGEEAAEQISKVKKAPKESATTSAKKGGATTPKGRAGRNRRKVDV